MKDTIVSIINDAIHAPSGENAQPWKFTIEGDTLYVFNAARTAHTLYNSKEKASFLAHGALLEIIAISATHYGYRAKIDTFPDSSNTNHVATITFIQDTMPEDILYPYILTRCCNRNYYTGKVISDHEQEELLGSIKDIQSGTCIFLTNPTKVKKLVKTITVNEQLPFEIRDIHDFFYKHLLWKESDQLTKRGFYVKTLESSTFKILGMKMLSNWYFLSFLNLFGTSKIIAFIFGMKYATSGAFGLITTKGNENKDYLEAGRMTERVWLTATKLGLAMQPCTGLLYLDKKIQDEAISPFSEKHTAVVRKTCATISDIFDQKDTMQMLFRIGYAEKQKDVSLRIKPEITFL